MKRYFLPIFLIFSLNHKIIYCMEEYTYYISAIKSGERQKAYKELFGKNADSTYHSHLTTEPSKVRQELLRLKEKYKSEPKKLTAIELILPIFAG